MGRSPRITAPGIVYHVLNRRVMRLPLFEKAADYEAFERVLSASLIRPDAPKLLAYCLMPNHWHLVVQAAHRTNLSTWMQWTTVTHTHRWHSHHQTIGDGPLYQGRFKSFPVQSDSHFLTVCRYVEANALRAGLVDRAQQWQWSSLWARRSRVSDLKPLLRRWPIEQPRSWLADVNRNMNEPDLGKMRRSISRATPLGDDRWQKRIATRLGLDTTMRPRGRPRKKAVKSS